MTPSERARLLRCAPDAAERVLRHRVQVRVMAMILAPIVGAAAVSALCAVFDPALHMYAGICALLLFIAAWLDLRHDLRALRKAKINDRAEDRGRELLLRLLTREERRQYQQDRMITIALPGGHTATIGEYLSGVHWQASNGRRATQCVSVEGVIKIDDVIGKLLALRTDPAALARVSPGMPLDLHFLDLNSSALRAYGAPQQQRPRMATRVPVPERP